MAIKRNLFLLLVLWFGFVLSAHADDILRLATTTSTDNSGLMEKLIPVFEKKFDLSARTIVGGSGRALSHARNGDVDAIFVHSKNEELELVDSGYGVDRREIMYNEFIIVGPEDDPAGIHGSSDLSDSFRRIAESGSIFISRGDDSGTHKKELDLWEKAGVSNRGDWYKSVGAGMGKALQIADELRGYILTDKGTWLFLMDHLNLPIHVEGAKDGRNVYGVIAVNPERHPQVNYKAAKNLVEWLASDEAKTIISNYRVNGQQLFYILN